MPVAPVRSVISGAKMQLICRTRILRLTVSQVNMEHAGVYDVIITDAFGQTLDQSTGHGRRWA